LEYVASINIRQTLNAAKMSQRASISNTTILFGSGGGGGLLLLRV
jgi:hypothetical protein